MRQFLKWGECKSVVIIDKYKAGQEISGDKIREIDEIQNTNYDAIVIAILNEDRAKNIKEELENKYLVPKDKLIWEKPEHISEEILC